MPETRTRLFCESALLPGGWARHVRLEIDAGWLTSVTPDAPADGCERLAGPVVPGLANLHSHAFQRGMAGLAERRAEGRDSFWSWRETMYAFLGRLTPDDVEVIAAQAFAEMAACGFTSLGEFHYLHHGPDGTPYDDPAEMALRIAAAARRTGIGLTLLPVFYAQGGFGAAPPGRGQRRFVSDPDLFARMHEGAAAALAGLPDARIGVAPHSLRAVTPEALDELVAIHGGGPIHIHVAEQMREVEDCIAWSGRRPVRWLLDRQRVDERWCLVHATHMDEGETADLAASGAVAGLCPITEANLGDGLFRAGEFLAAGGRFGVGSDSNVRICAAEELRTLEYGQRLDRQARNVLAIRTGSTGLQLFQRALAGGAQALGRAVGAIEAGRRADLVVLDAGHPALAGTGPDTAIDGWVFAGDRTCVRESRIGGRRVAAGGRHVEADAIADEFRRTMRRLVS